MSISLGIALIVVIVSGVAFGWLAGIITFVICFGAALFFGDGFRILINRLFGIDD